MREILFRGKVIGRNQWVYGYYFISPLTDENSGESPESGWHFLSGIGCKPHHIIVQNSVAFSVDPDTIGQYTGVNDKNNNKIFEHDIIKANGWGNRHSWSNSARGDADINIRRVLWGSGTWVLVLPCEDRIAQGFGLSHCNQKRFEIVGNIFDNPDMLSHE